MEEVYIGKRNAFIFLLLIISVQIIGIILSIINNHFGSDFSIYYTNTRNFWLNQESYQMGDFFYLNYFYFLYVWMLLLPQIIGLFLHIFLTDLMFYYIIKNIKSNYEVYWFYANLFLIIIYSITFNTDIWIVFSFLLFLKYRSQWYSPLFLLLGFFKITPILPFGITLLIILFFERETFIKILPSLCLISLIIIISFLTSSGLISSVSDFGENLIGNMGIIVFFQPPHFCWWSFPIMVYTQFKGISIKFSKKIWIVYTFITLCYGFYIFIMSSSVLSNYLFGSS
ncbi:MAG: hypothetical protein ACFFBW_03075 [Promethearchaeota archaeon]